MGHVFVGRRRIGIERHDAIRGHLGQMPPIEADFEPPQVNPFQFDRLGRHTQLMVFRIEFHLRVFLLERHEVAIQFSLARYGALAAFVVKAVDQAGQRLLKLVELQQQLLPLPAGRRVPTSILSQFDALD